jgi:predicted MPP superfamily phosphohydrolase
MIGIGVKIPMLAVLFIDDIIRFFTWTRIEDSSRSTFLIKTALAIGSLPLVSLVYGVFRNPYRYKLYKKEVPIKGLDPNLDGLRIVQISDIHAGSFTFKEPIKNAIEIINQQNADLVFFTGDLVNSLASEMEPYIDIFDKITSKYGTYSILGNHDYGDYYRWKTMQDKKANMELLKEIHKRLGWQLLLNEH